MIQYLQLLFAAKFPERDERGASAVEYGLLVAGIAAVIVAIVFVLGDTITSAFSDTCTEVSTGVDGAANADCTP
ncbi:Flp family type IVb pilin [Nocardioides sp. CFH 31398]|uniref:Flp family type IVb pilin n=1 Tax=Nocardioides sp. CFH 31398 TaxID=2919579 RepID=UPI001F06F7E9|nr:Flp family type IVb pilin [Nocardioides sp. CFH 31398]MCH1868219.1 Flp family type IVb pilin [Nocardioides sp. CFH 31398]